MRDADVLGMRRTATSCAKPMRFTIDLLKPITIQEQDRTLTTEQATRGRVAALSSPPTLVSTSPPRSSGPTIMQNAMATSVES
jgi:hypothetical protein